MTQQVKPILFKTALGLSALCLLGALALGLTHKSTAMVRTLGTACPVLLTIGLSGTSLKGFRFTVCIVAAVVAAMCFPERFLSIGDLNLRDRRLIVVIVQLVMFGMGTQMGVKDFLGVAKMPRAVIIGIACQFSIMPLVLSAQKSRSKSARQTISDWSGCRASRQ